MKKEEDSMDNILKYTQKNGFELCSRNEISSVAWEKGASYEVWVKQAGFEEYTSSNPDGQCLSIFRSTSEPFRFVATLEDPCYYTEFFLPDEAALIAFRIAMAPLLLATCLTYRIAEIQSIATKWFRAEHGHHPDSACGACDPETAERLRVLREAREAKAREAKARS